MQLDIVSRNRVKSELFVDKIENFVFDCLFGFTDLSSRLILIQKNRWIAVISSFIGDARFAGLPESIGPN